MFKTHLAQIELLAVVLIILSTFWLRWKDVEQIPAGFEGDEVAWVASAFFYDHGIRPSQRSIWSLHETNAHNFPVSVKLIQLSFKLFGKDFNAPRKLLVLTNTLAILFFYLFLKSFLSPLSSIWTTALYAFSTLYLTQSSVVLPNSFISIFIWLAFYALTKLSKEHLINNALIALFSGLSALSALLTYNIAYVLPMALVAYLCFRATQVKIKLKLIIIFVVIFLSPLLLTSRQLITGLTTEATQKSFSLGCRITSFQDLATSKLQPQQIIQNASTATQILFKGMNYQNSDMLAAYPSTLINKLLVAVASLGLILSIFFFKKYWPLIFWLMSQILAYHLILGLNKPRMWLVTAGVIYIFYGIAFDICGQQLKKVSFMVRLFFVTFALILAVSIINFDLSMYYKFAINNPAYKKWYRELFAYLKDKNASIDNAPFIIVSQTGMADEADRIASFYYLAKEANLTANLRRLDKKYLKIYTLTEFEKEAPAKLNQRPLVVLTDNQIFQKTLEILKRQKSCQHQVAPFQYFSQITLCSPDN